MLTIDDQGNLAIIKRPTPGMVGAIARNPVHTCQVWVGQTTPNGFRNRKTTVNLDLREFSTDQLKTLIVRAAAELNRR